MEEKIEKFKHDLFDHKIRYSFSSKSQIGALFRQIQKKKIYVIQSDPGILREVFEKVVELAQEQIEDAQ